jgi:peptidyl-prolyl cis-trans isomerase D
MARGEIRGPVKTQFGYHIIQLEEVEAGKARSFEEVRAELEPEFRKDRSDTAFYDETQKLAEKAFASLTELASVADELNLELRKVTGFTRQGGPVLGADPGVIDAVFSEDVLERGQNSSLVTLGEDRALVLRVASRTPASEKPLADVRADVESKVRTQAARDAAAKLGSDALAKLKQGASWASVAEELKLSPAGRRWVTREDNIAPPKVLQAVFAAPGPVTEAKPHFGSATTDDGNFAVFAVSQVKAGDPGTETEQARTARREEAARTVGNIEFGAYYSEAQSNAKIVRNDSKVFE